MIGGHTAPALRRAVTRGHGWYGFALTPDDAARCIGDLRRIAAEIERPAELGELEITVTPRGRLTPERAQHFAAAGVHRLVAMPPPTDDGVATTIEAAVAAVADL